MRSGLGEFSGSLQGFILISGRIVVQFEDFKNPFPALERYQNKYSCFNDDIQGTGAVILAGIISAMRKTGAAVKDQRAVFMGAGSAGVGVAKQIVEYFIKEGLTEEQARKCFWFVDTKVCLHPSPLKAQFTNGPRASSQTTEVISSPPTKSTSPATTTKASNSRPSPKSSISSSLQSSWVSAPSAGYSTSLSSRKWQPGTRAPSSSHCQILQITRNARMKKQ